MFTSSTAYLLRALGKEPQLEVTQDIERLLRNGYDRITHEELAKVSELMNSIFLEMIGTDPEQGVIIRRAEIRRISISSSTTRMTGRSIPTVISTLRPAGL